MSAENKNLQEIMQNIFSARRSVKETVLFMEKGDVKNLLFPIDRVESVTSYDGSVTYTEGVDYVVEDGGLKVTETSAIPCITAETFYHQPDSIIRAVDPATGERTPIFWGEGKVKAWQVSVTYTHTSPWEGYVQRSYAEVYARLLQKLDAGEDVTVCFYGDSITWGANSSFQENAEPRQGSYAMLFTRALADLYGYTVKYVDVLTEVGGLNFARVPDTDYAGGERGTITYVNAAIGGWSSRHGVEYFDSTLGPMVEKYGCDLLVTAFGMNDGCFLPDETRDNTRAIVDALLAKAPDASVLPVSSMTPHTGTDWDHPSIAQQEAQLERLAEDYRRDGIPCAVACVHSVSKAVQERKDFRDYTGNNVNHPNDWFYRVYAQTLLQTVVGYEHIL